MVNQLRAMIEVDDIWEFHFNLLCSILQNKVAERITRDQLHDANSDILEILLSNNHVVFDKDNRLLAAYPLSVTPTEFKIEIDDIGPGFAMCAIDALGVAFTFQQLTTVRCQDHSTGAQLQFEIDPKNPKIPDMNLFVCYKVYDESQPNEPTAALGQCPVIKFYSDPNDIQTSPDIRQYNLERAIDHARNRFSPSVLRSMYDC